jgi:hypothetical protein
VAAATVGVAVLPGAIGLAVQAFGAGVAPWLVAMLTAVLAVQVRRLA